MAAHGLDNMVLIVVCFCLSFMSKLATELEKSSKPVTALTPVSADDAKFGMFAKRNHPQDEQEMWAQRQFYFDSHS